MSKNREGVLIHTYGPEFHNELIALLTKYEELVVVLGELPGMSGSSKDSYKQLERRIEDALRQLRYPA